MSLKNGQQTVLDNIIEQMLHEGFSFLNDVCHTYMNIVKGKQPSRATLRRIRKSTEKLKQLGESLP